MRVATERMYKYNGSSTMSMVVLNELNRANPLQFPLGELPTPYHHSEVTVYVSPHRTVWIIGDGIAGKMAVPYWDNRATDHGFGTGRWMLLDELLREYPDDSAEIIRAWDSLPELEKVQYWTGLTDNTYLELREVKARGLELWKADRHFCHCLYWAQPGTGPADTSDVRVNY